MKWLRKWLQKRRDKKRLAREREQQLIDEINRMIKEKRGRTK